MNESANEPDLRTDLPNADQFVESLQYRPLRQQLAARHARLVWRTSLVLRPTLKRLVDVLGSLAGLIVLSPLLSLTALLIKLESTGPALYSQQRVGKRGDLFTLYKFRSMRTTADAEKEALLDSNDSSDGVIFKSRTDPRITRTGQIIRRLSIDELPQLFNVLKGEMSLVGPRPALPEEVAQYDAQARKRLQTKPGLTCLWQIGGRSDLPFRQQVDLDVRYLSAKSFLNDLVIILKTIPAVISGKGAY